MRLDNQGLNASGVGSSTLARTADALKAWGQDGRRPVGDRGRSRRRDPPNHPLEESNRNSDEIPGNGTDDDGNGSTTRSALDFAGANIDSIVPDNDPTDDIPQGGHGTHTAGTIAPRATTVRASSREWLQKSTLMPIRVRLVHRRVSSARSRRRSRESTTPAPTGRRSPTCPSGFLRRCPRPGCSGREPAGPVRDRRGKRQQQQ